MSWYIRTVLRCDTCLESVTERCLSSFTAWPSLPSGVLDVICCSTGKPTVRVVGRAPVMAVLLDGFEVLCVDVLQRVFQQRALQGLLWFPGLRPRLQVLLYGFGDSFVMRRHDLSTVLPVNLRPNIWR